MNKFIIFVAIVFFGIQLKFFLHFCEDYSKSVPKVDLIAGTNTVSWSTISCGETACGDGKSRTVTVGFREDGIVVWRIDQ